jgi:hypothetical protein
MAVFGALHPVTPIDPGGAIAQRQTANLPFLAKLELGQHLRATVQAALSNGEFALTLHSQDGQALNGPALHMKLPAGARPGDIFNLTFVARLPRPEFALAADTSLNVESPSLLSGIGRFIGDLLSRPVFPNNPSALSRNTPLLERPPSDGFELSLRLAQAMGRSGLFYESHQAQWIAGAKPLSELLREPQAHLAGLRTLSQDTGMNEANARATVNVTMEFGESDAPSVPDRLHLDHLDSAHPEPDYLGPVHRDALALVRQQLEVLETRHIAWQGEAWPGQALTLEAFEEDCRGREGRDETDQDYAIPWKTRLRLDLPNLGRVIADLRLHRHGLEISFCAPDHATTAILRSGAASLAHDLEGAGIKLLGMGVNVNEERD